MQMHRRDFLSTAVASIMGGAAAACAEEVQELSASNGASGPGATNLRSKLDTIQTRLALPAIGGVVVSRRAMLDRAACGFCKMGEPNRVTDHAHWQIGSITKTFTATLTALLVDRGKLSWDTTLGEIYPQHVSQMADGVSGITIRQIVTHK